MKAVKVGRHTYCSPKLAEHAPTPRRVSALYGNVSLQQPESESVAMLNMILPLARHTPGLNIISPGRVQGLSWSLVFSLW